MANSELLTWDYLLTASLEELIRLNLFIANSNLSLEQNVDFQAYSLILESYFRSDLNDLLKRSESIELRPELRDLTKLRYYYKRGELNHNEISFCQKICSRLVTAQDWISAECYFVFASICYASSDFNQAKLYFQKAISQYEKIGCIKKAIRSRLNLLATLTCENVELKVIPDYLILASEALKVKEWISASTCYINISRELQIMKAFKTSFENVKIAIDILESRNLFQRELGLCYIQAADVLFDQGRAREAISFVEKSMMIDNKFVCGAIQVLIKKHGFDYLFDSKFLLLPTWKERLEQLNPEVRAAAVNRLGDLEEKLVNVLASGAKNKFELIDLLYPEEINLESKEERLKNLISRVRKKIPNTLIFSDNCYKLVGNESF